MMCKTYSQTTHLHLALYMAYNFFFGVKKLCQNNWSWQIQILEILMFLPSTLNNQFSQLQ